MMGNEIRYFAPLPELSLEELVPKDSFYRTPQRACYYSTPPRRLGESTPP
jgi:hypothetical protein